MTNWFDEEFADISLKDKRRNRRFMRLVASWWERFGSSIASNCKGWAEQMAAYRLFSCKFVTLLAVLSPHRRMTIVRAKSEQVVLLVQDTTELDYEGKPIARTVGEVGPTNTNRRVGMLAHVLLALTTDRKPLGVLGINLLVRDRLQGKKRSRAHKQQPIEEKESYRWYQGFRTACALQRLTPETKVVSISDREGDIYEVLLASKSPSFVAQFIIRACQDRIVISGRGKKQPLKLLLHLSPVMGHAIVDVPAAPGRTARKANFMIHAQEVTFRPPYRIEGKLAKVTVNAVMMREVKPPSGENPIEWVLLTSMPISTVNEIQTIIQYYTCRWEIEVFFRLWKSGCHVESFQWHTRARMAPTLALCAVLTWRIHLLGRLGQTNPDDPCTVFCTDTEWKVIAILAMGKQPKAPPTVSTIIKWIAKLGGFAGRRSDGPPGPLVLMRGWLHLQDAFRLYDRISMEKKCV